MARVKRGVTARARHKKILKRRPGAIPAPAASWIRTAKQAIVKAGQYAFRDRRVRKRDSRAVDHAASTRRRVCTVCHSRFMNGLHLSARGPP